MYAHAPVIVVRPRDDDTDDTDDTGHGPSGPGPVVVGVDCSASAQDVLAFAFEEATHRRAPLVALHVGPTPMPAEVLAGCAQQYPEVRVIESVRGVTHPAAALIEASRGAALVVVGSRGRGGFASLLLGSVSQALIGHAYSCVAVVRPVTKL
jgi:nucleotide-binding universal stress UspA family protein